MEINWIFDTKEEEDHILETCKRYGLEIVSKHDVHYKIKGEKKAIEKICGSEIIHDGKHHYPSKHVHKKIIGLESNSVSPLLSFKC